ncbi:sulfatase-like hydrolase/transferase [Halobacteriaceae archaeon GCM10025711]
MAVQDYMKKSDEPDMLKRRLGFFAACLDHDHPAKSLANGVWSQVGPRFKSLPLPEFVDDGAATISQTAADTAETVDEPFFLFANFMDAHTPLRNLVQHDRSLHSVPDSWSSTELDKWELNKEGKATEEYTQNYRDVYGASIDYLDRVVDGLIDDLERATGRETTVVVVSDHGHNLGYDTDDGLFHHTGTMTEGVLHTPCEIINPPEGYPEAETRYLSHLELGDLLAALAHDEAPPDDLHREMVPSETIGLLGEGDGTWGREFSDDEYAHWNRMIRVVYDGTTKYQWNSLGESYEYDLDPDRPGWQAETATDVPIPTDATDLFDQDIIAYKDSAAERTKDMAFDDSVTDRLEQLGYL